MLIISVAVSATGMFLSADPVPENRVERISGRNRFGTAVAISQEGWETSDYVVLARGDEFADALAGAPLAYSLDAPILLTHSNRLPDSTRQEIIDLKAKTVIILGGKGAISQAVEDDLIAMGLTIDRISGANRYDTAGLIAKRMKAAGTYNGKVIVANGMNFPDALAASAYAARLGYPIILCPDNRILTTFQSAIDELNPEAAYVIGGTAVINDEVMDKLPNPKRVSGKNRYGTATALAEEFKPGNVRYFVATGFDFADAIAGGVLAAKNDAGLLLVSRTVPSSVIEYIANYPVRLATILGGTGTVSEEIEAELEKLLDSAALAQAIVAAQGAIDGLPEQVAAAEDSTEAQGYVDAAQDLINAVLALNPGYDTAAWDAVIAEQQAIVDAMKTLEEATDKLEAAVNALNGDGTDNQATIDIARAMHDIIADMVELLPECTMKASINARLAAVMLDIDAAQEALAAVNAATAAVVTAENAAAALVGGGTDTQAAIDAAQELYDTSVALVNSLPDSAVKTALEMRLTQVQADIDAAQAALDAVNEATAAVVAAENAANALAGDGSDPQAAIDTAQDLYDTAAAQVEALPEGAIKTGLEARLAQVQVDIDAAQAALAAVNYATAAVEAAENVADALAKDGTDTQKVIDAARNLYDTAVALVSALPNGAIEADLEARLAQVQADINAAQDALDAGFEATAAVVAAENAANALAVDGADTQADIDAAQGFYDSAAAIVSALPEGSIKTGLEVRLARVQADINAVQEVLDAVNAATAAVVAAENDANALAGDGTDTQEAIDVAQDLHDAAAARVEALPDGDIKTGLEARLAQVQADIDAAQAALDAVNNATSAVEAAENAADALAKDGTDTQEVIDATQNLYDAAVALVSALPDGAIEAALETRLAAVQADIDAAQATLDAVNAAIAAVEAAEVAVNTLAGNGTDDQAAIDAAQDLYDAAAAQVEALPDGDIKTGLEARLAQVQADIDAAQAALDAVNNATAAVEAAKNAVDVLAGDGTDTQEAIDAARGLYDTAAALVNALPDGKINIALVARLALVQADIDSAQGVLNFLKAIQEIEAMIAALPFVDELTLSDHIDVQAALDAYEALSEEQQDLVSNLATLVAAEDKIAELVLADVDNRIQTTIGQLNLEGTGISGITYADKHAIFTISDLNIDIIKFADSGVLDLF
ncbi:cell wall-binding repeat-containing protein, partial [Aminicella lysinilytica]|uniref:cell wall-binding repeat-containing protein n=1 Tax=Aminicella lysinilytica TaxID=433323 RepID=UPI0026ED7682